MNPFYTHQKYLVQELDNLDYSKPVLVAEFGTGDGSTSIFHAFALKYPNLTVESFESDMVWLQNMYEKYAVDNYHFHHVDFWDMSGQYDLAFVDCGDWDARIKIIDKIKAKVIILHDYDYYNKGICEDIFSVSKGSFYERFEKDFTLKGYSEILPPTLIMRYDKR